MQLLGVVLCGALLLGVAADSTLAVSNVSYPEFNVQIPNSIYNSVEFQSISEVYFQVTKFDFRLGLPPTTDSKTAMSTCGSSTFDLAQPWYILKASTQNSRVYDIQTKSQAYQDFATMRVGTLVSHGSSGGSTDSSPTIMESGKYIICMCVNANCAQAVPASNTPATNYTNSLGNLHVLDTKDAQGVRVGPDYNIEENAQNPGTIPSAPLLVLQADAEVSVSWIFDSSLLSSAFNDKFMVIDIPDGFMTSANAPGTIEVDAPQVAGFQCGRSALNDNVSFPINVRAELDTLPTSMKVATNSNPTGTGIYPGSETVAESTEVTLLGSETTFDSPAQGDGVHYGFLCYCRAKHEGSCTNVENFGAALGPIVYRKFTTSHSEKHFTVASSEKQVVQIETDLTPAKNNDRLGLVRLNTELSQTNQWKYGATVDKRRCGWSNLDVFPERMVSVSDFRFEYGQFPKGVDPKSMLGTDIGTELDVLEFEFDFALASPSRYMMCLCRSDFWVNYQANVWQAAGENNYDPLLSNNLNNFCPLPDAKVEASDFNNNGAGNFYNLFYANQAGYLHVVNTFGPEVNVVLQSASYSYPHVNFRSRPGYRSRDSDAVIYNEFHSNFLSTRFFVTTGQCSSGKQAIADSGIEWTGESTMFARVIETGANKQSGAGIFDKNGLTIENDAVFDSTPPTGTWDVTAPPAGTAWGALYTLTTGWGNDPFKSQYGAQGYDSSDEASKAATSFVKAQAGAVFASASAVGLDLTLCMCDGLTEFSYTSTDQVNTCELAYKNDDFSHFVEVGQVHVSKFVFSKSYDSTAPPKHYTLKKDNLMHTVNVPFPEDSDSISSMLATANDKMGLIPAYGDGYGVDTLKPGYNAQTAYPADAGASKAVTSRKPWKLSYQCGRDHFGTARVLYRGNNWTTLSAVPPSNAVPDGSGGVELTIATASLEEWKYQMCYCSQTMFNSACPENLNSEMNDKANRGTGFVNAYRYSDFAGFLHVVSETDLFAALAPGYALKTVAFSYNSSVNDEIMYVERSDDYPCGVYAARGAGVSLNSSDLLNTTVAFAPDYDGDNPERLDLDICLCMFDLEQLEELVGSSGNLNPSPATACGDVKSNFGTTLGSMNIQPRAFQISDTTLRHFTVMNSEGTQAITITNFDSSATITVSSDESVEDLEADHIGFLKVTNNNPKTCGVDQLDDIFMMVPMDYKTESALVSKGFDFKNNAFDAHSVSKVCYCQAGVLNQDVCTFDAPSKWFAVGILHVVDVARFSTFPMTFVLASGRSIPLVDSATGTATGTATMDWSEQVLMEIGRTNDGTNDVNKYELTISDVSKNAEYTGVTTFSCGSLASIGITGASNFSAYQQTFAAPVAGGLDKDDDGKFWWDTSSFGATPSEAAAQGETLGVDSYKILCGCDKREVKYDTALGLQSVCKNNAIAQFLSDFADLSKYGVTLGKVYFAKTISLQPEMLKRKANGPTGSDPKYLAYASYLRNHYTIPKAADASITVKGVETATARQAPATNMDQVGFLDADTKCGTEQVLSPTNFAIGSSGDAMATFSSLTLNTDLGSTQAKKLTVCICRYQLWSSCASPEAFFENAGFLHVISADVGAVFVATTDVSTTVTIDFASATFLTSGTSDRAAIIPLEVNASCGTANEDKTMPTWAVSPNAYEVAVLKVASGGMGTSSDRNILSSATPSVDERVVSFADVIFDGRSNFQLCYCGFQSEGNTCNSGPYTVFTTSTTFNADFNPLPGRATYYSTYGATVQKIRALEYITTVSTQAWTLFNGADKSQLRIITTPTAVVTNDDKWALIEYEMECGDATTYVKQGPFAPVDPDKKFSGAQPIACVSGSLNCSMAVYTQNSFNDLSGISVGKYKLCLCSAAGTTDSGSCTVNNIQDYANLAGTVNVLGGDADPMTSQWMVRKNDAFQSLAVTFGADQNVQESDRFMLFTMTTQCGEGTPQYPYDSVGLSNATYDVSANTLRAGPLEFTTANVYSLCFCSVASEGSCDSPSAYSALLGFVVVSGLSFDSKTTSVIQQGDNFTTTLSWDSSNYIDSNNISANQLTLVPAGTECSISANMEVFPTNGGSMTLTWTSNLLASKTIYRACILSKLCPYVDGTCFWDLSEQGLLVSDLTVTPKTAQTALASIALTYTSSATFAEDYFWFQLASEYCSTNGQRPTMASNISTASYIVKASTYYTDVDFTQAVAGSGYRLCIAEGCGFSNADCDHFLDYHGPETTVRVYNNLTISPAAVLQGSAQAITISGDGLLPSGSSVWFSNPSQGCSSAPAAGASTVFKSNKQVLPDGSSAQVNFNFSSVEQIQTQFVLCGETPTGQTVNFGPSGVFVSNISVSVNTVNQGSHLIRIGDNNFKSGDFIYFRLISDECTFDLPVSATATSTEARVVTADSTSFTARFDFTQMSGESRICYVPAAYQADKEVMDLDVSTGRVTVTDLSINVRSVRARTTDQELVITYGDGVLAAGGKIWFELDFCSNTSPTIGTASSSDAVSVGASGVSRSFDFAQTTASNKLFNLCYLPPASTDVQSFLSIGVFVVDISVAPRSVFREASQSLLLQASGASNIFNGMTLSQFRHSSVECDFQFGSGGSNLASDESTINSVTSNQDYRCGGGNTCYAEVYDFSNVVLDASFFRLCVFADLDEVRDYDVVQVHVVDMNVRSQSIFKSNAASIDFTDSSRSAGSSPNSLNLQTGDKVWFLQWDAACAPTAPDNPTTGASNAQLITENTLSYSFDFSSVFITGHSRFSPCVLSASDGTVRFYNNIELYVHDIRLTNALVNIYGLDLSSDPPNAEVVSPQVFLRENDEVTFKVASEACDSSENLGTQTKAVTISATFGNSIALNTSIPGTTNQVLRMCVKRGQVQGSGTHVYIDLDVVTVAFLNLGVLQTEKAISEISDSVLIDIDYKNEAIIDGDKFFLLETDSVITARECIHALTSTQLSTDYNSEVQLVDGDTARVKMTLPDAYNTQFEFGSTTRVRNTHKLCLLRGVSGVSQVVEIADGISIVSYRGARVRTFKQSVVRPISTMVEIANFGSKLTDTQQEANPNIKYTINKPLEFNDPYGNKTLGTTFNPTLISFEKECSLANNPPADSSSVILSATAFSTGTETYVFDFSGIAIQPGALLYACLYQNNLHSVPLYGEGVIVSSLTIMGSSPENTVVAHCLTESELNTPATISFGTRQGEVFPLGSKLYFSAIEQSCPRASNQPNANSSAASSMVFVESGATEWSMDFDFKGATIEKSYKLCVELESGEVLDYDPLSIYISGLAISTPNVRPTADVRVLLGDLTKVDVNVLFSYFLSASDPKVTCACAFHGNCSAGLTYIKSSVEGVSDPHKNRTFDFSNFNTVLDIGTTAYLCLGRGNAPNTDFALSGYGGRSCLSVGFGVTLSQESVPSNAGQLVAVTFDATVLKAGDEVMFVAKSQTCDGSTPTFSTARTTQQNLAYYSSHATIVNSGDALTFDFNGMSAGVQTRLCVNSSGTIFSLSSGTLDVTEAVTDSNYDAAGLYGDPHVRSSNGEFLDFYGQTGVYTLLDGNMQANAKFGYAVRDNFMIWHPKVMRPGTLVEEVGIQLKDTKTTLRLGTQGGGIVSVRENLKSTEFWAAGSEAHSLQVGDYSIKWATCEVDCEVTMPWGTHQRTHSLTVRGRGELLQLFVAKSGGYRFVDIEAMPSSTSTGLLADATNAPDALAERLLTGGELAYQVPFVHMLS